MGRVKGHVKDERLFLLIKNFLLTYLPTQRNSSENTITVYRTALNQFLQFVSAQKHIPITSITFDLFSFDMVNAYLDNLTTEKGLSPATRNNRLAALRAFVSYASACYPEYIALASKLSAIKVQKDDPFAKIAYMSEDAIHAILEQPDMSTKIGIRDQFMMILLYDTGARIQELLDIRICDIKLGQSPQVILHGKGNKVRTVPLMKDTVVHLNNYMYAFHNGEPCTSTQLLFYVVRNGNKTPVCDDTVRLRMQKCAEAARCECLEVPARVHPHLWRHSRAMHLYQHGMNLTLISQWLGHANLETTLIYAYADTEHKRDAIEKAMGKNAAHGIEPTKYTVTDEELLKRLYGL